MTNKECEDYFRLCNYKSQKKEFEPPTSGLVILKSQAAPEFRTCYPQASSSQVSGNDVYTSLWLASWQQVILVGSIIFGFLVCIPHTLIRIQLCSQGGGLSKNKSNWWRWSPGIGVLCHVAKVCNRHLWRVNHAFMASVHPGPMIVQHLFSNSTGGF